MGGSSSDSYINRQINENFNATINKIKHGADKIKDDAINNIQNDVSKLRTET